MNDDFWGSISDAFQGLFQGNGFNALASNIIPAAAGGLVAAGANALFPGTNEKVKGLDVRTGTGQQAEALRLQGAQGAGAGYQKALQGQLDPREEYLVRKGSRSADAARGALMTGGSARREQNAVTDRALANRAMFGSQLGSLSSGFQNLQQYKQPAQASPWAALGGVFGSGLRRGLEDWMKPKGGGASGNYDEDAMQSYRAGERMA